MKKIIFILGIMLFSSCEQSVVLDLDKRADATTVALQRVAQADSTTYHVVFNDRELIVLDDDYMVIAKGEKRINSLGLIGIYVCFFALGIFVGFKVKQV